VYCDTSLRPPFGTKRSILAGLFKFLAVGLMAILKLLRGLSRMNHSFVLIKERCRNEVIGNALFPCVPFDEVDATFYATIRHDLEPTWDDWRVAA
jgi:hypothetical protein